MTSYTTHSPVSTGAQLSVLFQRTRSMMKRDRMPPTPAMTSMASKAASLHTRAALKYCCLNASICSSVMARKPPMNLRMAMSDGP